MSKLISELYFYFGNCLPLNISYQEPFEIPNIKCLFMLGISKGSTTGWNNKIVALEKT